MKNAISTTDKEVFGWQVF